MTLRPPHLLLSPHPGAPRRPRPVRTAALLAAAALALGGCSAAQDAVAGATNAASEKASQVADDAKAKASAKASELAVKAAKAQICNLVKDGALSGKDAEALDAIVTAGEAAGLPKDVLALARTVAQAGTDASAGQVSDLQAKACTA